MKQCIADAAYSAQLANDIVQAFMAIQYAALPIFALAVVGLVVLVDKVVVFIESRSKK